MSEHRDGMQGSRTSHHERGLRRRRNVALIAFGAAAAYFLLTEHRAHTIAALPWVILLLCPLMHLFLHREHGGHGGDGSPHDARHHGVDGPPR